jgi:hypothetical protein
MDPFVTLALVYAILYDTASAVNTQFMTLHFLGASTTMKTDRMGRMVMSISAVVPRGMWLAVSS